MSRFILNGKDLYGAVGAASNLKTVDTSGLVGTAGSDSNAQTLIDDIADRVINKLALKSDVMNKISWRGVETSVKKNLLSITAPGATVLGVTFRVNSDGTVTANGTATANGSYLLHESLELPAGDYIFTDESTKVSALSYCYLMNSAGEVISRAVDDIQRHFTLSSDSIVHAYFWISDGTVYNNDSFKPMIRYASIEDDAFAPYIPDNTEVLSLEANNILGAKNLLPNNATSQTINGITFTVNSDGSVTANGTASGGNGYIVTYRGLIKAGRYILSGCPSGGGSSKYRISIRDGGVTTAYTLIAEDIGDGSEFTIGSDISNVYVYFTVTSGNTVSNLVIYPMIRPASVKDDTYVPYAMTNFELTPVIQKDSIANQAEFTNPEMSVTCKKSGPAIIYGTYLRSSGSTSTTGIYQNGNALSYAWNPITTESMQVGNTVFAYVNKGDVIKFTGAGSYYGEAPYNYLHVIIF